MTKEMEMQLSLVSNAEASHIICSLDRMEQALFLQIKPACKWVMKKKQRAWETKPKEKRLGKNKWAKEIVLWRNSSQNCF